MSRRNHILRRLLETNLPYKSSLDFEDFGDRRRLTLQFESGEINIETADDKPYWYLYEELLSGLIREGIGKFKGENHVVFSEIVKDIDYRLECVEDTASGDTAEEIALLREDIKDGSL